MSSKQSFEFCDFVLGAIITMHNEYGPEFVTDLLEAVIAEINSGRTTFLAVPRQQPKLQLVHSNGGAK